MRIFIAGGGSAGWMSAAYLSVLLAHRHGPGLQMTVVESSSIGRIGVGEATVPTIVNYLSTLQVPEREFMKAAEATFKLGIRFDNWLRNGHRYFHPFDRAMFEMRPDLGADWLRRTADEQRRPFAYEVSPPAVLCDAEKAPKKTSDADYVGRCAAQRSAPGRRIFSLLSRPCESSACHSRIFRRRRLCDGMRGCAGRRSAAARAGGERRAVRGRAAAAGYERR